MKKNVKNTMPKFFCENCGKEVKRNTRVCPHCGRFFASVRCPECNYLGSTEEFINGCPECGYAFTSDSDKTKKSGKKKRREPVTVYKSNRYDDPLPWWVYSLVMGLALVLAVCFFKL
ncbi:double zinc ribbon domain-containing protein [Treponema pedis]|uniref:double zinc ribbon domain-containing protein n=1 Tax=Treponema pedis TaxID=409322 RepID=UPI0004177C49|nr:zinc ribbon domain-containing protein [Treponema pedis]QSI04260.1 zinc ribbon domain-containing protein [Treponema pedis]